MRWKGLFRQIGGSGHMVPLYFSGAGRAIVEETQEMDPLYLGKFSLYLGTGCLKSTLKMKRKGSL